MTVKLNSHVNPAVEPHLQFLSWVPNRLWHLNYGPGSCQYIKPQVTYSSVLFCRDVKASPRGNYIPFSNWEEKWKNVKLSKEWRQGCTAHECRHHHDLLITCRTHCSVSCLHSSPCIYRWWYIFTAVCLHRNEESFSLSFYQIKRSQRNALFHRRSKKYRSHAQAD
jgi:hypothetical protein